MKSHMKRHLFLRRFLPILLGMVGYLGAAHANDPDSCTKSFKGQRISLVVTSKAGGGIDAYARLLAPFLEQSLSADVSVNNMPAAEGMAGLQTILRKSPPGMYVLGITNPIPLIEREYVERETSVVFSDFALLGVFSHGNNVWITRKGVDPISKGGKLLAGGNTRGISTIHLPAMALGLEATPVKGLNGSNDAFLALQRGDIDILVMAEQVFERGTFDTSNLQAWMFMSPPKNPELRNARVLTGPEGWVSQQSSRLPLAQQQRRLVAASLAEAYGTFMYAALIAQSTATPQKMCLKKVIENIAFSPEFIAKGERQRLDPRPMRLDQATALARSLQRMSQEHRDVIDEAMQRMR